MAGQWITSHARGQEHWQRNQKVTSEAPRHRRTVTLRDLALVGRVAYPLHLLEEAQRRVRARGHSAAPMPLPVHGLATACHPSLGAPLARSLWAHRASPFNMDSSLVRNCHLGCSSVVCPSPADIPTASTMDGGYMLAKCVYTVYPPPKQTAPEARGRAGDPTCPNTRNCMAQASARSRHLVRDVRRGRAVSSR